MRGDDDATVAGGGRRSRRTRTATGYCYGNTAKQKALSLCFRVGGGVGKAQAGGGTAAVT
jgi:hypothetical protein